MSVRAMLLVACSAIAADAYTTYAALTSPSRAFGEAGAGTAALISSHGLVAGIALAAVTRLLVFALIALLAIRLRYRLPVLLVGYCGGLFTWWLAVSNVWTVTHHRGG